MLVREQGYQSEHRHELELQLLSFVRHSFRQRVEFPEQNTDRDHRDEQEYCRDHEQHIGLSGRGNEGWQVRGCCFVGVRCHGVSFKSIETRMHYEYAAHPAASRSLKYNLMCRKRRCVCHNVSRHLVHHFALDWATRVC